MQFQDTGIKVKKYSSNPPLGNILWRLRPRGGIIKLGCPINFVGHEIKHTSSLYYQNLFEKSLHFNVLVVTHVKVGGMGQKHSALLG